MLCIHVESKFIQQNNGFGRYLRGNLLCCVGPHMCGEPQSRQEKMLIGPVCIFQAFALGFRDRYLLHDEISDYWQSIHLLA
jgi:hypothetical protein